MSILPVLLYDNPILRMKAEKVPDPRSRYVRDLIRDMEDTMKHEDGIGLAAPQVGVSLRVIVMRAPVKLIHLINPSIDVLNHSIYISQEGCLSVPGKRGIVERYVGVKVSAFEDNGKLVTYSFKGLAAAVVQHEMDHLEGRLFFDKILGGYDLLEDGLAGKE
jgi:peptide deformylase